MKQTCLALLSAFLICGLGFAQTPAKLNLTRDGIKPVVFTFDESYTAGKIYSKIKSWNASNIKYPPSAIRVDKENTLVKLGGYVEQGYKIRDNNFDHWYPIQYTMNIEIKDSKCRILFEVPEVNYKIWYNPDGSVIKKFADTESSFETTINKLLTSLVTYIKETPKKAEDNW